VVFTDNDSVDPWAAAQFMVERTSNVVPLVAVQPAYMHPYTAARMVSTIGVLHGRRIDLNFVTGGYRPHLRAVGSFIGHDERYDRLVEYGRAVLGLLAGESLSLHGQYFDLVEAVLSPGLPAGLMPRVFVAGASPAAVDATRALAGVRLTYPRAVGEYVADAGPLMGAGIRLGIIARDTSGEAWRIARRRYPADSAGEVMHEEAARGFDAQWHSRMWRDSGRSHDPEDAYWLHPFRVTREFCPYLVGSHSEVGELLSRYLRMGVTMLILSVPQEEGDLHHAITAIRYAEQINIGYGMTSSANGG
jgi:alkanesulfonate monooxygenase